MCAHYDLVILIKHIIIVHRDRFRETIPKYAECLEISGQFFKFVIHTSLALIEIM